MAITKVTRTLLSTGIVDNSNATAITIDSSENVGIGLTNQANKLQVDGDICIGKATTSADLKSTLKMRGANGSNQLQVFDLINDGENGRVDFKYNRAGNAAQTIMSFGATVGNVGIGTTSPARILSAKSSSVTIANFESTSSTAGLISFSDSNTTNDVTVRAGAIGDNLVLQAGGLERMRIDSSGNVGIGNTVASTINAANVSGNLVVGSGSGTEGITVYSGNTGLGSLCFADGTSGTSTYTGYLTYNHSSNHMEFGAGDGLEKMRINSSGCVGIGSTADRSLGTNITTTVTSGSAGSGFWLSTGNSSATSSKIISSTDGSVGDLLINQGSGVNGGSIRFSINDSEKARVASNGTVKVGTTSTVYSGGEKMSISSTTEGLGIKTTTATKQCLGLYNSDAGGARHFVRFALGSSGTEVGNITSTGSTTAYNTSSDARLKDVTGSARGLEVINKLNPVAYNWKADGQADEGLIAQEVLDIVPNAVSGSEEEMYQMDYSKLVVHLVAGMKEQQTQIEALQSEINLLKGE